MNTKICAVLLSAAVFSFAGCGGEKREATFPVTGTLTLDGQPVAGANVVLSPKGAGTAATAVTEEDGTFSVGTYETGDGAVPGEYSVTVNKYDTPAEPAETGGEDSIYGTDEEMDEMDDYGGAQDVAESKNELPAKYASASTSGLTHTVTEAATTLNIEL